MFFKGKWQSNRVPKLQSISTHFMGNSYYYMDQNSYLKPVFALVLCLFGTFLHSIAYIELKLVI